MTQVIHVRDMKPGDVYIGRKTRRFAGSVWANPFRLTATRDREEAKNLFRGYIKKRLLEDSNLRVEFEKLRAAVASGARLACWCAPNACHGDVLVELLEATKGTSYALEN